jgi:hypothetical protein
MEEFEMWIVIFAIACALISGTAEIALKNKYCIAKAKDKTIFIKGGSLYYILEVKEYKVMLQNIDTEEQIGWIYVENFSNYFKETKCFLLKI